MLEYGKVMIFSLRIICLYLLIDHITDDDGGNDEGLITYLFSSYYSSELYFRCSQWLAPQTSPSCNLQGASRITGGVFRGRRLMGTSSTWLIPHDLKN